MKNIFLKTSFSVLVVFLAFGSMAFRARAEILIYNQSKDKLEQLIRQEKMYLLGIFSPSQKENFILVSSKYTTSKNSLYLRKETYQAFLKMRESASKEKIDLKIVSGTRNFLDQKNIFESKMNGTTLIDGKNIKKTIPDELERVEKVLEYTALPGTSRHHWGTDIDLNNVDEYYYQTKKGRKIYDWLVEHAGEFGFCQVYTDKNENRENGYEEEKWHWSYVPISKKLTQEYQDLIKEEDIKGFTGDSQVPKLNVINNYVLSINQDCI